MEPNLLTTLDQIVPGRTIVQSDYAGDGYWKTCKFVVLCAEHLKNERGIQYVDTVLLTHEGKIYNQTIRFADLYMIRFF